MEGAVFSVRLEELSGIPVIKVEGELCLYNRNTFNDALAEAKRRATEGEDAPLVVVDFSDLGFVDSEGLGAVIVHMDDLKSLSGEVRLVVGHNGPAAVLLNASNKQGLFPLYNTAQDAVNNQAPMA